MNSQEITVLMSVFNCEKYVAQSIESILGQTYENIKFLIINDASEDNTPQICEKYSKKDDRISLMHNKNNLGLTKSLNKLLEIASTEIIARQDGDDISHKNRFELQIDFMQKKRLDFVYSRSVINQTGKIIPKISYYLPQNLIVKFKNPYIHGTMMGKRKIIKNLGNYDENFLYSQDYKLITEILRNKYKVEIMKKVLYESNFDNNISTLKKEEQKYYAECVRKRLQPNSMLK